MDRIHEIAFRIEDSAKRAADNEGVDSQTRYHAVRNAAIGVLRRELEITPYGRAPHQVFVLAHRYGKKVCDTPGYQSSWDAGIELLLVGVKKLLRRKKEGLL